MIGHIRGTVEVINTDNCIVDVNGIGYRLFLPASTLDKLVVDKTVTLHTYLHVREDALGLFGFLSVEEYDLFGKLITVTGIGPKAAINILSAIQPVSFYQAVRSQDLSVLTSISGIGKKTAERIILELKDKIADKDIGDALAVKVGRAEDSRISDVLEALTALGYNSAEVMPIMKRLVMDTGSVEELIKSALKELARK